MKRPVDGRPFYPLAPGYVEGISKDEADFMKRRVGGLAQFNEMNRSVLELLANAYLMGLKDAVEAYELKLAP